MTCREAPAAVRAPSAEKHARCPATAAGTWALGLPERGLETPLEPECGVGGVSHRSGTPRLLLVLGRLLLAASCACYPFFPGTSHPASCVPLTITGKNRVDFTRF